MVGVSKDCLQFALQAVLNNLSAARETPARHKIMSSPSPKALHAEAKIMPSPNAEAHQVLAKIMPSPNAEAHQVLAKIMPSPSPTTLHAKLVMHLIPPYSYQCCCRRCYLATPTHLRDPAVLSGSTSP